VSLTGLARLCVLFCFVFFLFLVLFFFLCFVGLMDMNNIEEDQVVHDTIQVIGNNGALPSMMGLHDVLRNIEQMLTPFKCYIEASEASMTQAPLMAQALPRTQTLFIAQTTHTNVPEGNAKEPKFIMPEKFDGLD
jgi:hypothetical protein